MPRPRPRARRNKAMSLGVLSGCAALLALSQVPSVSGPAHASTAEAKRYIVVYHDSVVTPGAVTQRREREQGFLAEHRFGEALKGFAAKLVPDQVSRLRKDRAVAAIVPDQRLRATALTPRRAGETVPTGVRRIGAATATRVGDASGARVAVLDTGIDLGNADLNATDGVNCVDGQRGKAAWDTVGHGTHVAGIIGARNQGADVVGLAPGTEVVAVKVLDRQGAGWVSDVICGIEWVTATRTDRDPDNDIQVANLSLGAQAEPFGPCPDIAHPFHAAVCRSIAVGVTLVAAAGNEERAFDDPRKPTIPAAYPDVLTVTAMSDTDGDPGGRGPAGCSGDDVAAPFSNFATTAAGHAHTIAAPGSCIESTRPGGGIARRGGTSMAAPHVAGLVALCHEKAGVPGACADKPVAEIVELVLNRARSRSLHNGGYGFDGDPREGRRRTGGVFRGHLAWGGGGASAARAQTCDGRDTVTTRPRLREGERIASAKATADGERRNTRILRGKRSARISLRDLSVDETRLSLHIATSRDRVIRDQRRVATCRPR